MMILCLPYWIDIGKCHVVSRASLGGQQILMRSVQGIVGSTFQGSRLLCWLVLDDCIQALWPSMSVGVLSLFTRMQHILERVSATATFRS